MRTLLDPTNDYVFKRLFAEAPELLVSLINDLRPDLPRITSVEALNPAIEPGELKKADRLGFASGPLAAWVTFFKHWQEEATMSKIAHEPVQTAMNRIRQLSADEEAQRLAFVRERALRDEVSLLKDAREEGLQEGRMEGRQEGAALLLRKLITLKFGPLPEWAEQALSHASEAQLDDWSLRILSAESLDRLLGKH